MQTFLNQVGKVRADKQHVARILNKAADYKARNTQQCNAEFCQLSNYVQHQADTIIDTRIGAMQGIIPFSNSNGWRDVQEQGRACIKANKALLTGQLESKKTVKLQQMPESLLTCKSRYRWTPIRAKNLTLFNIQRREICCTKIIN